MSALQPYGTTQVVSLRSSRQLTRIADTATVEMARANAVAETESTKLDALQQIAGRALQGVAMVSQLEQQLAQMVPIAATRLQAIGDMHALATADVMASAARKLR